jgi:secreted Zn-dependent insulinase-like peptidase
LKSALQTALTANPKDFAQDNERYWKEILSRKNQFNRPARMARALQEVTRDEFIGHFETLFFSKSTRRLDV